MNRLQQAVSRRAVTEITTDICQGVADADVTVVCAPVESIAECVRRAAACCPASGVITDAGSTKSVIVAQIAAQAVAGQAPFLGSHPLAGSEKTGVAFARDDLFDGRTVVITPVDATPPDAIRRIQDFWQGLGARVTIMTPEEHDRAVAATSHLPHLVAAALASVTPEVYLPLVGTGWLDSTRVAAGDVELWRQILSQNRGSVLQCLEQFEKVLNSLRSALQQRDDTAVTQLLSSGKQRRDALAD
jgi:prephenate dehydrogenase